MFIFWLAFALGATTSISRTPRPWVPNESTGGAWVQQQDVPAAHPPSGI